MPRIPSARKPESGADVFEVVPFEAKPIVTVEEQAPLWTQADVGKFGPGFAGAFVRLKPPKGTPERRIREVEAGLREAKAAAVKVLRPREDAAVVEPRDESPVGRTAREEVLKMAAECRTRDRAALERVLLAVMDREGL